MVDGLGEGADSGVDNDVDDGVGEGEKGVRSGIAIKVAATVGDGDAGSEPEDLEGGAGSMGTIISTVLAGAADSSSWHPVNKLAKKRHPENNRTNKKNVSMSPD